MRMRHLSALSGVGLSARTHPRRVLRPSHRYRLEPVARMFGKFSKRLKHSDPASARSKNIDKQMRVDFKKQKEYHKILLLGTGESGKTTILKQMRIIHINGYTDDEKRAYVMDIRNNVHESIYNIAQQLRKKGASETSSEDIAFICNLGPEVSREVYTQAYYDIVQRLWSDASVQAVFHNASDIHLLDSTSEFMSRLEDIRRSDYVPSTQEILYCRIKTTAISNITFEVPVPKKFGGGVAKFSMFDVGGQRDYRRKWITVFEDVDTLLFVISCSDFDQCLREDESTNRLAESLALFENMFNSRYLRASTAIIFLNKEDLLAKKVKGGKSLGSYFSAYLQFRQADDEVDNTKLFIRREITKRTENATIARNSYVHFTIATSTQNIMHIFDSVHESIIEKAVNDIILL